MDKKFNENLRALRKERGLTQSQIADALGIKLNTYSHMELDGKRPSIDILQKLSKLFLVSIDSLTGEEIKKKNDLFINLTPIEPLRLHDHGTIVTQNNPPELMKDLRMAEQNIILRYRLLSDEEKIKVQKYVDKMFKNNIDK